MSDRDSKRPPSDLTPIGRVIADSIQEGFLGLAKEMVRVFEVWDQAVGPYVASKARPESVKNGRLTVVVESSVWIDHFNYLKSTFLEQINQALGSPMIQDIAFRVGPLPRQADEAKSRVSSEENPSDRPVNAPEIAAAISSIEDPELRESLARLLARQKPRRPE